MVQLNSNLTLVFDHSQVFTDFFESLINDHVLVASDSCSVMDLTQNYFTNLHTNFLTSLVEEIQAQNLIAGTSGFLIGLPVLDINIISDYKMVRLHE